MTEILDIYDDQLNKIGTKERGAVHRDGDWHKVFHCWVAYRDVSGRDFVVLQRRGANTEVFPNLLDISAAGHYQAGETIYDGVREVQEELGITVDFDDLIPLGVRIGMARYENLIDHQFADVFLLIHDQDISTYHYQVEELAGLVALPVDEGLELCAGDRDRVEVRAVGLQSRIVTINNDDLIPTLDDYLYKMLILVKRALNGEKHLRI
ncbi:MAG: NUDIX domain-containing protein [Anaerolineaceae bacterium]|nr:NUDIX domain-containing protein [Anaerolineaceae bacterium]